MLLALAFVAVFTVAVWRDGYRAGRISRIAEEIKEIEESKRKQQAAS